MKKGFITASMLACAQFCFGQFNPSPGNPNNIYFGNQVGIGLQNPAARLDVQMGDSYMYDEVSGFRLTYPIPALGQPPQPPIINTSIFEIRQKVFGNNYSTKMVMNNNGNLGIGIPLTSPLLDNERVVITDNTVSKIDLHVQGFSLIDGEEASLLLGRQTGAQYGEWGIEYNNWSRGLNFWKPSGSNNYGNYFLFISDGGNVSIGTEDSKGYKLAVKGSMIAEKVVVKLYGNWPDFVFSKNHKRLSLPELETYINQNSHLPDVPSAEEVEKGGIDLGTMDATLLQKIEELTLYVIELKKEIEALKKEAGK